MKNLYLALAIVGAVVPYAFFIDFMGTAGLDLAAFEESPSKRALSIVADYLVNRDH